MRAQHGVKNYARVVRTFQPGDYLVEFQISRNARRDMPSLPKVLTCRLIHYQIQGCGSTFLLTSLLDPLQFPAAELAALYHRRWRIETIFREWKHTLKITGLRAHTRAGISKEMHAHLMLSNLTRFVMTEAADGTGKTALEFSFVNALSALKNAVALMSANKTGISELYCQLLATIRRFPILQRPGRRYPRRREKKPKTHSLPATCTVTFLSLT